jgi:hypothetical protein
VLLACNRKSYEHTSISFHRIRYVPADQHFLYEASRERELLGVTTTNRAARGEGARRAARGGESARERERGDSWRA